MAKDVPQPDASTPQKPNVFQSRRDQIDVAAVGGGLSLK